MIFATAMKPITNNGNASAQFRTYTNIDIEQIPQLAALGPQVIHDMKVVAQVLPFRANSYVVDHLIDWRSVPDDPMFRLVFPSRGMLDEGSFADMARALDSGHPEEVQRVARQIRMKLNPHPADQLSLNRPLYQDRQITGLQHKYAETVLFFPSEGQTCHAYCTFCFRWPQFIRDANLRIAMSDRDLVKNYITSHSEVTDLLVTGGDAFTIKARRLRFFLAPFVEPELAHVTTIRLGTKALSFWPYRFVTDPDAGELIELVRWLVDSGKHVAIMAHYNHWRELTSSIAQEAICRLQAAGAVLRSQGPLLRGINDDAITWETLWRSQVKLGVVPYYMFISRDTGPRDYFCVPLARAWTIYSHAARRVSGLARTVRGPAMSVSAGKIEVTGVAEIAGERVFVLRFLQSRNPAWAFRPFFAKYDGEATWLDDLRPAFAEKSFFFAEEQVDVERGHHSRSAEISESCL
jgi:KamA family protein